MGIALVIVVVGYLAVVVPLGMWMAGQVTSSKKAKWVALPLLLVAPFWRPLLCSLLFKIIVREPLREILQTVESPESVYWQDDIWPGFDAYGRKWMVDQYLDGVHLKALALNGDDGKIYFYRADPNTFAASKKAQQVATQREREIEEFRQKSLAIYKQTGKHIENAGDIINNELKPPALKAREEYRRLKEAAIKQLSENAEIYVSSSQLPTMCYQVHFVPLDNWWREAGVYHADQITVTEGTTGKIIAFSRRYMEFAFWMAKFSGKQPKYLYGPGDQHPYEFDDKVLFGYVGNNNGYDSEREWKFFTKPK